MRRSMMDKDALQHFIQNDLLPLEKERVRQQATQHALLRQKRTVGFVVGSLLLLMGLYVRSMVNGDWLAYGLFAFFTVIIVGLITLAVHRQAARQPDADFVHRVKHTLHKKVLAAWFPQFQYAPEKYIEEATYQRTQLYRAYDLYQGGDYFSGKLSNKQPVRFSELHTQTKNNNGDNSTEYNTVFQGLFFEVTLPKNVKGRVKILPDKAERSLGKVGVFLQKKHF